MKRIDDRTVELTDLESNVHAMFHDLLDEGLSIPDAAHAALTPVLTWVGPAFIDYLSDGTLRNEAGVLVEVEVVEDRPRWTWWHLLIIAIIGGLIGLWLSPGRGYAAEPYGGCDEAWQAPHSQGADDCRALGWTVRPRFVLSPKDRVKYLDLRPCEQEDSDGPCYWNAQTMGNGEGDSFIIRGERDGKHRIWWVAF